MLSAVSELMSDLFGYIFVQWLSCEAIEYLLGMAFVAIIITFLFKFLRP